MTSFILLYAWIFLSITLYGMYRDTKYFTILKRINMFNIFLFLGYVVGNVIYAFLIK